MKPYFSNTDIQHIENQITVEGMKYLSIVIAKPHEVLIGYPIIFYACLIEKIKNGYIYHNINNINIIDMYIDVQEYNNDIINKKIAEIEKYQINTATDNKEINDVLMSLFDIKLTNNDLNQLINFFENRKIKIKEYDTVSFSD